MSPLSDDTDALALPETILAEHGAWTLRQSPDAVPDHLVSLQAAFVGAFPACVDALSQRWPLPEGIQAHVILAQEQECLDWGVDEEALGFHAICATTQSFDDTTDQTEFSLDLPADHRCYVNLAGIFQSLCNDEDDTASRLSALMTLPHEMGHVALFARHTQGRTPLQVFDEDGGEAGIQEAMAAIEEAELDGADHGSGHGAGEDAVESFAATAVDGWMATSPDASSQVSAILARMPRRQARPRG